MRGRIATCSERLPRCEFASVSPTVVRVGAGWPGWLCASTARNWWAPSSKPAILRVFYVGTNKRRDIERITDHNPQPLGIRAKCSRLVDITQSDTMASQSNIMSFRNDPVHRKMAYLSVKRSAPFRISGRPMKVGRRGRNPALLMAKMEILQRHPEATTDWVALTT
jgi:hypothetical protein